MEKRMKRFSFTALASKVVKGCFSVGKSVTAEDNSEELQRLVTVERRLKMQIRMRNFRRSSGWSPRSRRKYFALIKARKANARAMVQVAEIEGLRVGAPSPLLRQLAPFQRVPTFSQMSYGP